MLQQQHNHNPPVLADDHHLSLKKNLKQPTFAPKDVKISVLKEM